MIHQPFVPPDEIRAKFSSAMSDMYQVEVPLYGALLQLVAETNHQTMEQQPELSRHLRQTGEIERLNLERHGAIRVGTAAELATLRRLFAVMGMFPVGYYDWPLLGSPFTLRHFVLCMRLHYKPSHSEFLLLYCVWS